MFRLRSSPPKRGEFRPPFWSLAIRACVGVDDSRSCPCDGDSGERIAQTLPLAPRCLLVSWPGPRSRSRCPFSPGCDTTAPPAVNCSALSPSPLVSPLAAASFARSAPEAQARAPVLGTVGSVIMSHELQLLGDDLRQFNQNIQVRVARAAHRGAGLARGGERHGGGPGGIDARSSRVTWVAGRATRRARPFAGRRVCHVRPCPARVRAAFDATATRTHSHTHTPSGRR